MTALNGGDTTSLVSEFLKENPSFFIDHPEIFSRMKLPGQNPEGTRSILELQNEALQGTLAIYEKNCQEERAKAALRPSVDQLEKIVGMSQAIIECRDDASLPYIVLEGVKKIFNAHYGIVKLWYILPNFSFLPFGVPLGPDVEKAISQMAGPYCGPNEGDAVAAWLEVDPKDTRGVLICPLRLKVGRVFGFLCLSSPEPNHFDSAAHSYVLKVATSIAESALSRLTR